jgi:hypothetical protein
MHEYAQIGLLDCNIFYVELCETGVRGGVYSDADLKSTTKM